MPSGQNDNDTKRLNNCDSATHYALSQNDHFRLKTISNALLGVAALTERHPSESDPEIASENLSSIFRLMASSVEDVLTAAPLARHITTKKAA